MNLDAKVNNQIKRNDFAIILACNRQLASIYPVRLARTTSDRKAGLVLGRYTSGANSGFYGEYDDAATDGRETAVGVLFEDVLVEDLSDNNGAGVASGTAVARMIVGGEVYYDKLTGLDANGQTDLKARLIVDGFGTNILKF